MIMRVELGIYGRRVGNAPLDLGLDYAASIQYSIRISLRGKCARKLYDALHTGGHT